MFAPSQPQSQSQSLVHPLLRHPRPITRDTAKAQRMLGLIADSEEKALQREKSVTTRWLERPMYGHLDVSDVESERSDDERTVETHHRRHENYDAKQDNLDLKQWNNSDRRVSFDSVEAVQALTRTDTADSEKPLGSRHTHPTEWARPSYSQHSQSTEWSKSTTTKSMAREQRHMSLQIDESLLSDGKFLSLDTDEPDFRLLHRQTWAPQSFQAQANTQSTRTHSPQPHSSGSTSRRGSFESINKPWLEGRPRPTSFATFQTRDRSKGRIASSRGQKLNSHPNFSRPISRMATETAGDVRRGSDAAQQRYADVEVASPLPMTPARLSPKVLELSKQTTNEYTLLERSSFSRESKTTSEESKPDKRARNRWSTIPNLLKFAKRRSSMTAPELERQAAMDELRSMNPAVYNNQPTGDYPAQAVEAPPQRGGGGDFLPTPEQSPLGISFDESLRPPFAPWAGVPPSPPPSLIDPNRRKSSITLPPTAPSSQPRSPTALRPTSLHSRKSSTLSTSMMSPTSMISPTSMMSPASSATQSRLSVVVPPSPRAGVSRRGTPSLERTCILCKGAKDTSEFSERRITSNCWHETSTCLQCLQEWVERHLDSRARCACPECGEAMAYGDVSAFATDALGQRADGRHWG